MVCRYLRQAALIALSLMAVVSALEVFIRVFNPQKITPVTTESAFGIPNSSKAGIQYSDRGPLGSGYDYRVTISDKHLRGASPIRYEKPKNTYRVLCLGNSIMAGLWLNDDEHFPHYLNQILTEQIRDMDFEVINAGVNGWELPEFYTFLVNEGYKYRPDFIILAINGDPLLVKRHKDIRFSSFRVERLSEGKVKVHLDGFNISLAENPFDALIRKLLALSPLEPLTKSSHLLNMLRSRMSQLPGRIFFQQDYPDSEENILKKIEIHPHDEITWVIEQAEYVTSLLSPELARLASAHNQSKEMTSLSTSLPKFIIGKINAAANKIDAKLLVLETPDENQLMEQVHSGQNGFRVINGVPYLKLAPDFVDFIYKHFVMLVFPKDNHLLPAGNRLAAYITYNALVKHGFLPSRDFAYPQLNVEDPDIIKKINAANSKIQAQIDEVLKVEQFKGIKYLRERQWRLAEESLSRYVKIHRDDHVAVNELSLAYMEQQKWTEAIRALSLLPRNEILFGIGPILNLGISLYKMKRYADTIKVLLPFLKSQSIPRQQRAELFFWMGRSYFSLNDFSNAELYLVKAYEANPVHWSYSLALGEFYFEEKLYAKALEKLGMAQQLAPQQEEAHLYAFMTYAKLGERQESEEAKDRFFSTCTTACDEKLSRLGSFHGININ